MTHKQKAFVKAMSDPETKSAKEAAIRAGYEKSSAAVAASRLSKNPRVRAAIDKRKAEYAEHADLKAETILGAACVQAFDFSIDDCLDANGYFSVAKARKTGAIHFIKSISRRPGRYGESVRFEMYSAETARQELADYLGMKQKPHEVEHKRKRVAEAVLAYMEQEPDTDPDLMIELFAKRHGFSTEEIIEYMDKIR